MMNKRIGLNIKNKTEQELCAVTLILFGLVDNCIAGSFMLRSKIAPP